MSLAYNQSSAFTDSKKSQYWPIALRLTENTLFCCDSRQAFHWGYRLSHFPPLLYRCFYFWLSCGACPQPWSPWQGPLSYATTSDIIAPLLPERLVFATEKQRQGGSMVAPASWSTRHQWCHFQCFTMQTSWATDPGESRKSPVQQMACHTSSSLTIFFNNISFKYGI